MLETANTNTIEKLQLEKKLRFLFSNLIPEMSSEDHLIFTIWKRKLSLKTSM